MSYELRRLRLHGLIERLPKTHRYRLTERGTANGAVLHPRVLAHPASGNGAGGARCAGHITEGPEAIQCRRGRRQLMVRRGPHCCVDKLDSITTKSGRSRNLVWHALLDAHASSRPALLHLNSGADRDLLSFCHTHRARHVRSDRSAGGTAVGRSDSAVAARTSIFPGTPAARTHPGADAGQAGVGRGQPPLGLLEDGRSRVRSCRQPTR